MTFAIISTSGRGATTKRLAANEAREAGCQLFATRQVAAQAARAFAATNYLAHGVKVVPVVANRTSMG